MYSCINEQLKQIRMSLVMTKYYKPIDNKYISVKGIDADNGWSLYNYLYYSNGNRQVIDLSSSTYDTNKWYPVYSSYQPTNSGFITFKVVNPLASNKPSWSTHSNGGFSAITEVLFQAGGWGTTEPKVIITHKDWRFCDKDPVGIGYSNTNNRMIFYLRGGGIYYLFCSIPDNRWSIVTDSAVLGNETVSPKTYAYNGYPLLAAFPVGYVYLSTVEMDMEHTFGGTWERLKGGFLYACNTNFEQSNGTGTETNLTYLTEAQLPNVTGSLVGVASYSSSATGVFSGTFENNRYNYNAGQTLHWTTYNLNFGSGQGHSHKIPFISLFVYRRTA